MIQIPPTPRMRLKKDYVASMGYAGTSSIPLHNTRLTVLGCQDVCSGEPMLRDCVQGFRT